MSVADREWVDLDAMKALCEHFRAAALARPKLFHATRVVLPGGEPPARPDEGWEEFLGADVKVFDAVTYERPTEGIQQSCYFGSRERLVEYMGLAAVAQGFLTFDHVTIRDYHRNPRFDRDCWSLAMYRIAGEIRDRLPIDLEGTGNYAAMRPEPWLWLAITGKSQDAERKKENLAGWQSRAAARMDRTPRHVYAGLSTDVFHASAVVLEYLVANAGKIYGPMRPSVITSFPRLDCMGPARSGRPRKRMPMRLPTSLMLPLHVLPLLLAGRIPTRSATRGFTIRLAPEFPIRRSSVS